MKQVFFDKCYKYKKLIIGIILLLLCFLFQLAIGFNLFLFAISFVGGCLLLMFYDKVKEVPPEKFFSMAVLVLGSFYLFTITPMSPPDEETHYRTAYALSNYLVGQDSEKILATHYDFGGFNGHQNTRSAFVTSLRKYSDNIEDQTLIDIPQWTNLTYFVHYLPQAVGLSLARLANLNFMHTFWMGRYLNLLFFTCCVYFSVKRIPKYKLSLGILCLFPITVQQAASYSYDSFGMGISFCLLAVMLDAIIGNEKIGKKTFAELLILSMLLLPTKGVYAPVILLFLLIPGEKFKSQKDKYLRFILYAVVGIAFLGFFQLVSVQEICAQPQGIKLNWEGGQNYTLAYCLQHPFQIIGVFLKTLYLMPKGWFEQLFVLSGLSMWLPDFIKYILTALLIAAILGDANKQQMIKNKQKIVIFIVFAMMTILLMCVFLLAWTSDNRDVVQGIQGRYFIPFLPLLFMLTDNRKLVLKKEWIYRITGAVLLMQWFTIFYIVDYTLKH